MSRTHGVDSTAVSALDPVSVRHLRDKREDESEEVHNSDGVSWRRGEKELPNLPK